MFWAKNQGPVMNRLEELSGCRLEICKDKGQREECGCVENIDVGTYNTCKNGRKYRYTNYSLESVRKNCSICGAGYPLLCGILTEEDKVSDRKMISLRDGQMRLDLAWYNAYNMGKI